MPHRHSQVKPPTNARTLLVGLRADVFGPEDLPPGMTQADLAAQIERGWAAFQASGIEGEQCLIGTDPDEAEAELRKRFDSGAFGAAMIGGGIRMRPEYTILFERIVNVLIDLAPGIRLSFNTGPETSLDAVRRWLDR